jgi:hypothetical protein
MTRHLVAAYRRRHTGDKETEMIKERTLGGLAIAVVLATSTGGGTSEPQRDVLFNDSFDDDRNGWGIVDHPEFGSASYADGDYVWNLKGSYGHLLPQVLGEQYDRGELDMVDVTVRVEATIDVGDGVVGVFCRESPDTDAEWQWYEFVARDGFAAVRRADSEGNLDVLAETDDVSLPSGEPMVIEATCVDDDDGNAMLTLSLDDTLALTASDPDPLENGAPGIQAYTYPIHDELDIRWHEISISRPATASVDVAPATSAGGTQGPPSTG